MRAAPPAPAASATMNAISSAARRVQPRVAVRQVLRVQAPFAFDGHGVHVAAHTFGHVFPRHLEMNPARVRPALLVDVEEGLDLCFYRRHVPRLEAVRGRVGVAVDGVADPQGGSTFRLHSVETEGRCSRSLSADMRVINVTLPGTFLGLNVSKISMTSSGDALSLIFTPTGFWMPHTNSK